jgi:hypothetical protein
MSGHCLGKMMSAALLETGTSFPLLDVPKCKVLSSRPTVESVSCYE